MYYYSTDDGEIRGPLSLDEVNKRRRSGQLADDAALIREDDEQWSIVVELLGTYHEAR